MAIRRVSVVSLLTAAVLTACGGGGDSSGMPTTAATSTGTSGAGATGGSVAPAALNSTGSISAFGSVFINGNHFDVSGAQITLDDNPATEMDLRVGQTATVSGTAAVGSGLAMATLVEVRSRVVGPVASVSTTTNSFVVLGQTVNVGNDTSFDSAITPADITGIHAGDLLIVHGMVAADGSIAARRIDRAASTAPLLVAGTVANVNATTHTFKLNALTVDYTSATLLGFSSGAPANGDSVRVRGTVFTAATTTLTATGVLRVPAAPSGTTTGIVEREGLVTRFASLTDFDIAGQKITTTAATVYVNGTSADVMLNASIEAHGTLSSAGVLTATVINVHHSGVYGLNASISALDATAQTVTVLGVTVTLNTLTRLEDHTAAHVRNFAFSDLRIGDNVAVMGYESPAGSGKLTATRLDRLPASTAVNVAGPFTATTAPQFRILGVVVNAASATFYADRNTTLTAASFFAQAVGRQVAVTGTGTAPIVASKVLLLPVDND